MDVKQAAEILGISSEGIRQRIRRGTLASEKDTDGRVYVFLDYEDLDDATSEQGSVQDKDAVHMRLEAEVEFLRQELATRDAEIQRRDAILLSLSEGLKALNPPSPEAPRSAREEPETASESPPAARKWSLDHEGETYGTSPQEAEESLHRDRKRSWWRRLFGP